MDNTALIKSYENSEMVIPLFIFDKQQISDHPYKSDLAFQFMLESLRDLQEQLQNKG